MTSYRTERDEPTRVDDCDLSDSWDDRYNLDFGSENSDVNPPSESDNASCARESEAYPVIEITSLDVELLAQVEIHAEPLPEPEETPARSPR